MSATGSGCCGRAWWRTPTMNHGEQRGLVALCLVVVTGACLLLWNQTRISRGPSLSGTQAVYIKAMRIQHERIARYNKEGDYLLAGFGHMRLAGFQEVSEELNNGRPKKPSNGPTLNEVMALASFGMARSNTAAQAYLHLLRLKYPLWKRSGSDLIGDAR